ncbi:hypothetical protein GCM10010176_026560 [Nonomuraea spiralis]|nr:hypothetical protein GCM10010176_026560 [Nonomuraea spiralis]
MLNGEEERRAAGPPGDHARAGLLSGSWPKADPAVTGSGYFIKIFFAKRDDTGLEGQGGAVPRPRPPRKRYSAYGWSSPSAL